MPDNNATATPPAVTQSPQLLAKEMQSLLPDSQSSAESNVSLFRQITANATGVPRSTIEEMPSIQFLIQTTAIHYQFAETSPSTVSIPRTAIGFAERKVWVFLSCLGIAVGALCAISFSVSGFFINPPAGIILVLGWLVLIATVVATCRDQQRSLA